MRWYVGGSPWPGFFFGLLILLNFILYSKYESRHKRHFEVHIAALFRWLIPGMRHECRLACLDT